MMLLIAIFLLTVNLVAMTTAQQEGCPAIQCPQKIRDDCRKAEFVISADKQRRCRVCDSNLCGKPMDNCPQIQCPLDREIPEFCRKPNFVMGLDGITKCRVCDSNLCGPVSEVCPAIQCPEPIPRPCRVRQFSIGTDGITLCRMCDKNGCIGGPAPP